MHPFHRTSPVRLLAVLALVVAVTAGCSAGSTAAAPSAAPVTATPTASTPATAVASAPPPASPPTNRATNPPPPVADWPSPADCVSYNPATLTVTYEAGTFTVVDGSTDVVKVQGDPSSDTGDKALALAQRYRRHCFLGRNNTREDHNSFVFDYWRDPSGRTPAIPDQDDDCSPYNNGNLTVEDMGDGNGWRVKDHDHVLQLFDNQSDARNGKLVLSKYHQICFIGDNGDNDPDLVSYFL